LLGRRRQPEVVPANRNKVESRRISRSPRNGKVLVEPVADNRRTAITEFRTLAPESRGEQKSVLYAIDFYEYLSPFLGKERIAILRPDANSKRTASVTPRCDDHCLGRVSEGRSFGGLISRFSI
jgi:hypothetical protein